MIELDKRVAVVVTNWRQNIQKPADNLRVGHFSLLMSNNHYYDCTQLSLNATVFYERQLLVILIVISRSKEEHEEEALKEE